MYLHAEMILLKTIVNHNYNKGKVIFIAVFKRSCYLCELYIRFINSKEYKVYTSGVDKKLYFNWLLSYLKDTDLKNESLKHMLKQLDQIINKEIAKHINIVAKSNSDRESVKTDKDANIHKIGSNLFLTKKPKKPKLTKTL